MNLDQIKISLSNYANHKIEPGSFLRAVLENDLFEAVRRADKDSLAALPEITHYVFNNIKPDCFGGVREVSEWLNEEIVVSDGYENVKAEPAKEGHVVIRGDGRLLPKNSFVWQVEHGNVGWWNCERLGVKYAERGSVYSVPTE